VYEFKGKQKKIAVSNLSPYGCANFPTHGEKLRKDSCLEFHNLLKNYQSKKLKKLGMKDRYIFDILAQEWILKIQYTIYGGFLKKVRKLSHKYSIRGCLSSLWPDSVMRMMIYSD
jgi:hypothetical protein